MSRAWLALGLALLGAGYFLRAFPDRPGAVPLAVATNLLVAWPACAAFLRWQGLRRGGATLAALALYAYAVELVGVLTGLPYGAFRYGDGLGPLLGGLVPLLLPLAYVPLVLGALGLASARWRPGGWRWILAGALALTAFDLVLDPGAVTLGYWRYAAPGAFHGVPASNFAGWLLTGAGAMALAGRGIARSDPGPPPPGLLTSATLMLAFWTGIAWWFRLGGPFLLGAGLVLGLLAAARSPGPGGSPGPGAAESSSWGRRPTAKKRI